MADSIRDLFAIFKANPAKTPHDFAETVEKDHGRIEVRRCFPPATGKADNSCATEPDKSKNPQQGKTSIEQRLYISSLATDATRIGASIRSNWAVENRLHWCMDVVFADDQMRARTGHAAHNLAVLRHITLNLIRLDPVKRVKRKGGIKARRLIAATSDLYRAQLLGLA